VHKLYKERKEEIYSQINKVKAGLKERKPRSGELDGSIIDEGLLFAIEAFDSRHGGFGKEPKFPQASMLTFCLKQHHVSKKRVLKKIVTKTLDEMGSGGMYDLVEGGFFRYSTTRDWSVPHYEKMLEDNANLAKLYLEAYHALGEERYLEKALDVLGYLVSTLGDGKGGFYGSQDADEDYYCLPMDGRKKMTPPFVDETVFTDWNGLAASAMLYAYSLTGDEKYRELSVKTIERVVKEAYGGDGGMYHYIDGEQNLRGLLADQVYFAQALLDAYQRLGGKDYLDLALKLVDFVLRELGDEEGGFYDAPIKEKGLGMLSHGQKPILVNADTASLLMDVSLLAGEPVYREHAEKTLKFFASEYPNYGFVGGNYFLAVSKFYAQPLHLSIVGSIKEQKTQKLLRESLRLYRPFKLVQLLDPEKDAELVKKKGLGIPESPTLYPCVGTRCLMPITDAERIAEV
jgi:hypothetical protein